MTVSGIILAFYLSIKLSGANGIDVSVVKHSLAYDPLFDRPPLMIDAIYVALTVVPLVCLDNRAIKIFGVQFSSLLSMRLLKPGNLGIQFGACQQPV
jgi:hypothetical protein